MMVANQSMIVMYGSDENGKFFLPLTQEMLEKENMTFIKESEPTVCDNMFMILPAGWTVSFEDENPFIVEGGTAKVPKLSFSMFKGLGTAESYGNTNICCSYRVGENERYYVPLGKLWKNRVYVKDMEDPDGLFNFPYWRIPSQTLFQTSRQLT